MSRISRTSVVNISPSTVLWSPSTYLGPLKIYFLNNTHNISSNISKYCKSPKILERPSSTQLTHFFKQIWYSDPFPAYCETWGRGRPFFLEREYINIRVELEQTDESTNKARTVPNFFKLCKVLIYNKFKSVSEQINGEEQQKKGKIQRYDTRWKRDQKLERWK